MLMIQVNLLPWREEARRRKKYQFATMSAGSVFLALIILFVLHMKFYFAYSNQNDANLVWQDAINEAQTSLNLMSTQEQEKNNLTLQLKFLAGLKDESYFAVRILQELPHMIPNTVSIIKIKYNGVETKLYGVTLSESEITKFLSSVSKSLYFNTPELTSIDVEKDGKTSLKKFQVTLEQKKVASNAKP